LDVLMADIADDQTVPVLPVRVPGFDFEIAHDAVLMVPSALDKLELVSIEFAARVLLFQTVAVDRFFGDQGCTGGEGSLYERPVNELLKAGSVVLLIPVSPVVWPTRSHCSLLPVNDPSSATAATKRADCNHDGPPPFAAAIG
jgi:hypothetical protein